MKDRVSEYGRKWDARIPRGDIAWIIRREHVGVTDDEIRTMMRGRLDNCIDARWTPRLVKQACEYAVACHHENQGLYKRVVSGHL